MANGNVALPANTWTKIANSGLTSVSWQVKSGVGVYVAATSLDAAPTGDVEGWPKYGSGWGEVGVNATTMFSGVSSAAHLWAYSPGRDGYIWVSHA